jgi:hypothetical protein
VVNAASPVPSVGQFENYCAVILCTILLHLTHWPLMLVNMSKSVTVKEKVMRMQRYSQILLEFTVF